VRAGALNACPWRRGSGAGEGGTPGRGGAALRPWEEEERAREVGDDLLVGPACQ
jgi:hypothetical protein